MPASGYTAITFVANEQPTTAKWNLIGSNDASFNNGNGIDDAAIKFRHIDFSTLTTASYNKPSSQAMTTTYATSMTLDISAFATGARIFIIAHCKASNSSSTISDYYNRLMYNGMQWNEMIQSQSYSRNNVIMAIISKDAGVNTVTIESKSGTASPTLTMLSNSLMFAFQVG